MAQGDSEAPPQHPANQTPLHVAPGADAHDGNGSGIAHGGFWTLVVGCIGVVYGDIGTSPLYAFRESIAHIANRLLTIVPVTNKAANSNPVAKTVLFRRANLRKR